MSQSTHHNSVTPGSLFSLSAPIFIDLLLHFSTLIINTIMVSMVSRDYVAAMGLGNQVFDLCITIFSFISVGCSVVIAQYIGSGNREALRQVIHTAISFNFIIGLICATLTFFFGYKMLELINMPDELMNDGFSYLHILGICLVPEAISLILAACLRVYGKAKLAMYITLIANVLTIFGNMLVLHGWLGFPEMGLVGVAWSTVIGRIVAVILLFLFIIKGIRVKLEFKAFFHWNKNILMKILRIGLPAAGENLLWLGQYTVAFAFIGLLGKEAIAGQTIYFQLALFIMLFGIAISVGNEIIVGHLVGAAKFDEAYKMTFKSLKMGLIVTILVAGLFWIFDRPILDVLLLKHQSGQEGNGANASVIIEMLLPLFLLALFLEPGRTFNIVMVNALRATGDAKFPFYTALIFMWGVSLPIGYWLGIKQGMGLLGIWLGFFCDEWLRGLVNSWRWKSRKWEAKRLV